MGRTMHEKESAGSGDSRRKGFTLVELLVVVAIIGALAGVLLPNIITARRKANQTKCLQQLKGIGAMLMAYADEEGHRGNYPFGNGRNPMAYESLQKLVDEYPEDLKPEIFVCPDATDMPAERPELGGKFTLDERSCSYAYLSTPRKNTASATTILLSDDSVKDEDAGIAENHVNGVNAYFADNSGKFLDKKDHFPDSPLPPGLIGNTPQ